MPHIKSFWKRHPFITTLLLFTTAAATLLVFVVHWAFYDISRIEPGELLSEEVSPGGEYTIKTYLNNGGATVDYAVLGVLYFNDKKRKPKNIYWQYEKDVGMVNWLDADTVLINRESIDVPDGKYDYRHP